MDGMIMRRPDRPAPSPAELRTPEPGDERELRAALADVERLHREYAALNAAHDAYAEAYAEQVRRVSELQAQGAARRLARRCRNAIRRIPRGGKGCA
jgi:primosomal protein N''